MDRLRRTRWLCAALIAPVLAFAVAASSYLVFRCSLTGMDLVDPCCQPAAGGPGSKQPPAHDSMADRSCCEGLVVSARRIPATVSTESRVVARDGFLVLACDGPPLSARPLEPALRPTRPHLSGADRPPHVAAPAFLRKQSFLI